jgi:predicted nucleotidyltransferase
MHIVPETQRQLADLAQRFGWRLVVLFGSSAAGAVGRDVDVAVMPSAVPTLFEQGKWVAALEPLFPQRGVDLLLLTEGLSPTARFQVFQRGVCLLEAEEGLFSREQDRAFFLYADAEKFRRVSSEMLDESV